MDSAPAIAAEDARRFVTTLFEPGDILELRLCKGNGATPQRWTPASAFDQQIGWLTAQNRNGFNCYIGVNPRRAARAPGVKAATCTPQGPCGACAQCVKLARSFFADFDKTTEVEVVHRQIDEARLPPPSILVHSGHGIHPYWPLDEPITDLALWTRHQQAIIERLGSDPVVHDPPRIMRLPGFLNVKREPYVPCRLMECNGTAAFPLSEFPEPGPPTATSLQSDSAPPTVDDATPMPDRVRRCQAYLEKLPRAIEGQHGSDRFLHACCECFRFGLDQNEALGMARWFSKLHSDPPWSDREIEHKLVDAKKKVMAAAEFGIRLRSCTSPPEIESESEGAPEVTLAVDAAPAKRRTLLRPQFPVDALPGPMAGFVSAASVAMYCDPAMLAAPMLAISASLIGTARWLRITPTWREPGILWVSILAASGSMKTPGLDLVAGPLHELEAAIYKQYLVDMEIHQHEMAEYTRQLYQFTHSKHGMDGGSRPQKPMEPNVVALTATDYTIEALADRLEANPKGVLLLHDELAGFFGNMDKYRSGRGDDESKLLTLWSGGPLKIDRAGGRKRMYLRSAAISVYGGVQPIKAAALLTPDRFGSGMCSRFLWCAPEDTEVKFSTAPIDEIAQQGWSGVVQGLFELKHTARGGNLVGVEVRLSAPAEAAYRSWFSRIEKRRRSEVDARFGAALSKMRGYLGRLALVLHMGKAVCGETPDEMCVEADTIEQAAILTQWFAQHAEYVYSEIVDAEAQGLDEKYIGIVKRLGGAVTPRELKNACRAVKDVSEAERILRALAEAGRGTFRPEKSARGGPAALRFRLAERRTAIGAVDAPPVYETPAVAEEVRGSGYVDSQSTEGESKSGLSIVRDVRIILGTPEDSDAPRPSGVYVSETPQIPEENEGFVDGACGASEFPPDDVLAHWQANGQAGES